MTIRFAAARPRLAAYVGCARWWPLPPPASNDNAVAARPEPAPACPAGDDLLRAALLHFAVHGLGAAAEAKAEALAALARGRVEEFRHWVAICRQFDRRMAARLARRFPAL